MATKATKATKRVQSSTPNSTPKKPPIPRGRLNSPEMVKLLLTVEETAHKLSVGRGAVYGLMRRGELRFITVGRVRRVPVDAVSEYVAHAQQGLTHVA